MPSLRDGTAQAELAANGVAYFDMGSLVVHVGAAVVP